MNKPFFLCVSILAAQPAFAMELPNYLQQKLDDNAASTSFQLQVNDTIDKISKEKNYREIITTQIDRDLGGWEKTAFKAAMSSTAFAMVGAGVSLAGYGESADSSVSSVKHEVTNESLMGTGSAMSAGGIASGLAMMKVATTEEVHNVLNETKADEYAATAAARLAAFFRLTKNKELALKFAIKEEIYRKDKAKDLSPMNLNEVIKNAKASGKPILSSDEQNAFAKLQSALEKTKAGEGKVPVLTDEEKIAYLIAASAMLETQSEVNKKAGKEESPELRKVKDQTAANRKILAEINEYRKNLGDKVGEKDDEANEAEHDAE